MPADWEQYESVRGSESQSEIFDSHARREVLYIIQTYHHLKNIGIGVSKFTRLCRMSNVGYCMAFDIRTED